MNETQRLTIAPQITHAGYIPETPGMLDLTRITGWRRQLLCWLAHKLGASVWEPVPSTVETQTVTLDSENVIAMISKSRSAMENLWHQRAGVLVVGHDEARQIVELPEWASHVLKFNTTVPLGNGGDVRWLGLRVVVVPWLSGWALLPEKVLGE